MKKKFKINKYSFPVNEKKYLLNFLTPTSQGTNYWDSPPSGKPNKRQFGRILLQVHQLTFFLKLFKIDLSGKNFLDVGTGNGIIPRLINLFYKVKNSYGIDPYIDGEHITSWQKHNQEKLLNSIIKFSSYKDGNFVLDYKKYKSLLNYEQHQIKPEKILIKKIKKKNNYRFKKISINQVIKLNKKFDFIYCKALEHITDTKYFFSKVSENLNQDGVFYLKHRSFFSYLGAHRYASTSIPWGHVLLSENQYKAYCKKFHKNRANKMIEFYFKGLTYPRLTVSDIINLCEKNGMNVKSVIYENNIYKNEIKKYVLHVKDFWSICKKRYPSLSKNEIFSGMVHLIFEKT